MAATFEHTTFEGWNFSQPTDLEIEEVAANIMFELAVRQFSKLDLLGGFYADNVNDGMWGNVSHPFSSAISPYILQK